MQPSGPRSSYLSSLGTCYPLTTQDGHPGGDTYFMLFFPITCKVGAGGTWISWGFTCFGDD